MKAVPLKQHCQHFKFSRSGFSNLGKRGQEMHCQIHLLLNVLKEQSDKKCYMNSDRDLVSIIYDWIPIKFRL